MLLYVIAAVIGWIAHALYMLNKPNPLDTKIFKYLKEGKRVIICVDEDATIFEMINNRIRISKALTNFYEEIDGGNLVDSNPVQSDNNPEIGG